jgi:trehalose 6-phosphate synthase
MRFRTMRYCLPSEIIVSSLHDGMNLVAKEFFAAKNDLSGILLPSRFTGAAREAEAGLRGIQREAIH